MMGHLGVVVLAVVTARVHVHCHVGQLGDRVQHRVASPLRDRVRLDLALDLLVPPLSLLAVPVAAGLAAALALRSGAATAMFSACAIFLFAYVLRGWMVSGTGALGLVALLCAPAFVAWKLGVLAIRSGTKGWVRTAREDQGASATSA